MFTDEKGRHGLLDSLGKEIIAAGKFRHFQRTGVPGLILCTGDSICLYDKKRKTLKKSNTKLYSIEKNINGIFIVSYYAGTEALQGLADKNMELIELPKFSSVSYNSDLGLFVCTLKESELNYYNDTYKVYYNSKLQQQKFTINNKEYNKLQDIYRLSSFATFFKVNRYEKYIRVNNKFIKTPYESYVCDSLLNYFILYDAATGQYGAMDFDGNEVLPVRFRYIRGNIFTNKISVDINNEKETVIDANGKILFGDMYDNVQPLLNDYYIVSLGGKRGIVNSRNDIVLEIKYEFVYAGRGGILYGNRSRNEFYIPMSDLSKIKPGKNDLQAATNNQMSKNEPVQMTVLNKNNKPDFVSQPEEMNIVIEAPAADDEQDRIFTKVEVEPSFPGGSASWNKFCEKAIGDFSPADNGAPPGKYHVMVRFIVAKDGSVSDVRAETNHGYGMEEKVVKIIKIGPLWKPAIQNGRNVNAYHRQQVIFIVEKKDETEQRKENK